MKALYLEPLYPRVKGYRFLVQTLGVALSTFIAIRLGKHI